MKTYRVTIARTAFTYIDVEAADKDEAEDIAYRRYNGRIDAWGDDEILEVEELGNEILRD